MVFIKELSNFPLSDGDSGEVDESANQQNFEDGIRECIDGLCEKRFVDLGVTFFVGVTDQLHTFILYQQCDKLEKLFRHVLTLLQALSGWNERQTCVQCKCVVILRNR